MVKWTDTGTLSGAKALDLPPIWLLGALGLVWAQVHLAPSLTYPHGVLRIVSGVLVLAGVALMLWAVAAFRTHQTSVVPHQVPARIITTGPFARSRNPIYLGDVMVLVGAILWWGAWPSVLVVPIFVAVLTRRFVAPEEARMKESFGAEFENYAQKTQRWV